MTIWEFIGLMFCFGMLILVAFIIPLLIQLKKSAKQLESTAASLNARLPEIMSNLDEISTNLSAILIAGRKQTESISKAVGQVTGIVDDVSHFERRLRGQMESPLIQSLQTVGAVTRAIQAFFKVLGNGKPS